MGSKGWGMSEQAGQGCKHTLCAPNPSLPRLSTAPQQTPGAEEGPYLGWHCRWAQGTAPRLAPPESPRQPQQPSRTCRCSSSSELLKAGLSSELAEGSPERDQYWAETSSRRQKRR